MDAALGIAGLITAAAITPGPNNFAILQVAARQGVARAAASIAGVVAGGLVMLAVCYAGLATWIAANPAAGLWIAALGSLYLGWLALRLLFPKRTDAGRGTTGSREALPAGLPGLFAFQFVNPKSWVLVLTATSVAQTWQAGIPGFGYLVALFIVIPTLCLLLWSCFGVAVASLLSGPSARLRFDRVMGVLLAASVLLLWR